MHHRDEVNVAGVDELNDLIEPQWLYSEQPNGETSVDSQKEKGQVTGLAQRISVTGTCHQIKRGVKP